MEPNFSDVEEDSGSDPFGFSPSQITEGVVSEQALNDNPEDHMSSLGRTLYNIAKSYHDQFNAKQAQELAQLNAGPIHSGAGIAQPLFGAPVTFGVYHDSVGPFNPLRDGFHGHHDYQYNPYEGYHGYYPYQPQEIPIPVAEEDNSRRTRDLLGEMERANATGQVWNLQLGFSAEKILTDPVVKQEPENVEEAISVGEELDLDLKL